jgi:hypothetical protein
MNDTEMELVEPRDINFYDNENYDKQLKQPKIYKKERNDTGNTYLVMEGLEKNDLFNLYAGPNEVFFTSQAGNRKCVVEKKNGDELNKNNKYSHIDNLRSPLSDGMIWGFLSENSNLLTIDGQMEIDQTITIPTLKVILDNKYELKVVALDNDVNKYTFSINVKWIKEGFHTLQVHLLNNPSKKNIGYLRYIKLSSYNELSIARERWRPRALHTSFSADGVSVKRVKGMIFNQTLDKQSMGCYVPFTTPFGYTGVSLSPEGVGGMNFSLWYHGKNDPVPPKYKFSRLLGIGHPDGEFSYFSHEGTGVKIRGWSPFRENTSGESSCALTMSIEPSPVSGFIATFYTYYWDETVNEWKLHGIGQKWKDSKPDFKISTFIEVTGGDEKERTGHNKRKIYYIVYVTENYDKYVKCNKMIRNQTTSNYVNNERGVENGKFYCSTGGFEQYVQSSSPSVTTLPTNSNEQLPLYMQPDKVKVIGQPVEFPTVLSHELDKTNNKLKVKFNTGNSIGTPTKLELYYGSEECHTLQKLWDHSVSVDLDDSNKGENEMTFDVNVEEDKPFMFRILVRSTTLQLWTYVTNTATNFV